MGFFTQNEMQTKDLFPGCRANLVHTKNLTLSQVTLEAGAVVPEHAHDHEQVSNVIEGQFEFTVDGITMVMGPGDVGVTPSNALHSGKALTNCRIIDVFYPVREDYKTD
jgi:quercetin dioxygenase-like cupin family protein